VVYRLFTWQAIVTVDPAVIQTLVDDYVMAQLAGDRRAAMRLILERGLGLDIPVRNLYLDVIQAAQYRIGDLWQRNRISVAQEHLATAISQMAIAELYGVLTCDPPNGRRALVSCVGGELHDLGTRITADFLEMGGFEVRYLGANVPTDTLAAMVRDDPPDLLVLSVTMTFHLDALRQAVSAAREAIGDRFRLAVGGNVFTSAPALVDQLGADVYGRDALESLVNAERVFGLPSRSR
jgi:MerR family transcriptional regulator, light-induced transcriptional regulator